MAAEPLTLGRPAHLAPKNIFDLPSTAKDQDPSVEVRIRWTGRTVSPRAAPSLDKMIPFQRPPALFSAPSAGISVSGCLPAQAKSGSRVQRTSQLPLRTAETHSSWLLARWEEGRDGEEHPCREACWGERRGSEYSQLVQRWFEGEREEMSKKCRGTREEQGRLEPWRR